MKKLTSISMMFALGILAGCGPEQPGNGEPAEPYTPAVSQTQATSEENGEPTEPADAGWITDFEQARQLAAKQSRLVLMNFTGSDWCPPCKMLHREVFAQSEFERYAQENLVLLELDFPRGKKQPAELVQQNKRLGEQFNIEGFPTLILLNAEGKEVKRTVGYLPGGPKGFIRWIEG